MDLQKIKDLAFEMMGNKCSSVSCERGEKYYHGERVASLAIKLRHYIYPNDSSNDDIIIVAAWFHDLLHGMNDHCAEGAIRARAVLSPFCTEQELSKICDIISVHDDRNSGYNYPAFIKLHQDADHLDHFGVFDIWRSFTYAIPYDQTILDVLKWMTEMRPLENERYKRELNFEISKKIFDEKIDFLNKFTRRFIIEGTGGIWDEDKLLMTLTQPNGHNETAEDRR